MDNNQRLRDGLLKADGIDPEGATNSEHAAISKMLDEQSVDGPSMTDKRPSAAKRTFFGAALAIEQHRHIRIDVVATFISPTQVDALRRPLYLIAAGVCVALTWAAMRFWYDDWQYVAEHERWSSILALITPFGFSLLTLHFLLGGLFIVTTSDSQS